MTHDLLVFGHRQVRTIPVGKPRSQGNDIHFPTVDQQGQRISPQLERLADAFNNRRATVQREIQGLEPESVIVFEVANGVDSFISAVQKAGMEWMGDWDSMVDADDDFYVDEEHVKKIPEKLYFTMTDQRALEQMLSLWEKYLAGDILDRGFTAFRDVFAQLRKVRLWNANDRFTDTGVSTVWEDALNHNYDTIRFEIELWFRENTDKRIQAQQAVTQIIESYGGRVLQVSLHPEIAYHGMIAECPADGIRDMMNKPNNPLFNADQVMWIRATGQAMVHTETSEVEQPAASSCQLPIDPPVVALFDGLPMAGHVKLNDRLVINDADGYEDNYPAQARKHGTEMASVILHGDLSRPLPPLHSRLYVRPIMRPNAQGNEAIPDDKLFVDVIHQAVMEIVNDPEFRSSVRIVNISVGDLMRPFLYVMSPVAKMLDYLGERYNLLFLVSAGNESSTLELPMTFGDYNQLSDQDKYKAVYAYLWEQQASMRVLAPAESVNSVTVGAFSFDYSSPTPVADIVDVVPNGSVTTYSRFGGGFRRSIKPDLVNMGGRLFYSTLGTSMSDAQLRPSRARIGQGPGIKIAVPTGGLTGEAYSCGTSHATALTSRHCADLLDSLRVIPGLDIPSEYEATAIKAMLIHSCSWNNMFDIRTCLPFDGRMSRKEALKWVGYGAPRPEMSMYCTDQRVTLIGYGSLNSGYQEDLLFPLPPCLNSQRINKRLTITLAWMSPIAANRKNYRVAKMDFNPKNNPLMGNNNQDSDVYTSKRGTIQHQVFEDSAANVFKQDDNIAITVSCRKEPLLRSSVKYVLLATLEVAEETQYPIYEEVALKLQGQVQVGS